MYRSPSLRPVALKQCWHHSAFHFSLLLTLSALLLFGGLHKGDLSGYDDAAYAHEAKMILHTGNWWTLSLNGADDFDKPPLFVWMLALAMKVFGLTDFAAKFPAALLGWGTVILVYWVAKELTSNKTVALLSMLVLISTQYFLKYATHAMTGVPCTFFFTLAIWAYLKGRTAWPYWLLCSIAIALTNWICSPVGFLLIGIILSHALFARGFSRRQYYWLAGGLSVGVLLSLSWHAGNYWLHGEDFLAHHFHNFSNHVFDRSPSDAQSYFHYLYLLARHYWPWLPLLVIGGVIQSRNILRERSTTALILLLWMGGILLPFSFASSKVLRYLLPAFPAFSIVVGITLYQWLSASKREWLLKVGYLVLAAAALVIIVFPAYQQRASDMKAIAPIAEAQTHQIERVILYTWGTTGWDYRNQFIWYSDRLISLRTSLNEVVELLQCAPQLVVILDKESFQQIAAQLNPEQIAVLARAEKFICLKKSSSDLPDRQQAQIRARPSPFSDEDSR